MHDARVFRLSPLYERLTRRDNFLPPFYHLIGDSAYPLLPSLMKPYQDNGHLTRDQQIYNTKLSSIRSIIERAFGLLKGKWRRLKYLEVNQPETASRIILACCVLHNFLLLHNNPEDDYLPEENESQNIIPVVADNQEGFNAQAEQKRRHIVNICTQ
ncbi:protein ALP1-like [Anoplophora glabripennis]|uniref:protein ALP1-like n=1 Tax=Anoplophora glabripennis TaxID=217634 RepID=UPI000874A7F6|nr:protein ALP1-like [Anoplophora glabripennis]